MKEKIDKNVENSNPKTKDFPGYPLYPASEDIYHRGHKVGDENYKEDSVIPNEKQVKDDSSEYDLDVPGAELDDNQEAIGNEDEENNYYSLGGDNHNDLEENQGDN
ncbi:MAG: hypothetical protein V4683_07955 [Bacteroidota bacterium]